MTNLGDQGVESVFGGIYPPQVALVDFGKITERPVAVGGLIGVRGHHPGGRPPGQRRVQRRQLPDRPIGPAAETGGTIMTPDQARQLIEEAVARVAPDADLAGLAPAGHAGTVKFLAGG